MSRLIKTLAKPITVPVAACTARVAKMNEPLKRHIDLAEAGGEDVCGKVWREYVDWQVKLLPYRWEKFCAECSQMSSGKMPIADFTFRDGLLFARFATKCLCLFLIFVMLGRRSVFPSLEPGSPFAEEIVKNWQINHVDAMPSDSRDSLHFLIANEKDIAKLEALEIAVTTSADRE